MNLGRAPACPGSFQTTHTDSARAGRRPQDASNVSGLPVTVAYGPGCQCFTAGTSFIPSQRFYSNTLGTAPHNKPRRSAVGRSASKELLVPFLEYLPKVWLRLCPR